MRRLEITPDDPDGEPLVFDIDYVQLKDFSPSRPASYEAHLTNPRPKARSSVPASSAPGALGRRA